jgi:hypothetical protein
LLKARTRQGEVSFLLRPIPGGLHVEREAIPPRGLRCKEIVQFTDRQHFLLWYQPDELRFDHPLLHNSLLRETAVAWANDAGCGPSENICTASVAGAAGDRLAHAASFIGRISGATDAAEFVTLAGHAVHALGADAAIVLNLDLDGSRIGACQLMLAGRQPCAPGIPKESILDNDPWIAHATKNSEPVIASGLHIAEASAAPLRNLAERQSLKSVMLVPVYSGRNAGRTTLLCLCSTSSGFFEGEGFTQARMGARLLAAELHAWQLAQRRQQLVASTVHKLTVVTRNVADFAPFGVPVLNPFKPPKA